MMNDTTDVSAKERAARQIQQTALGGASGAHKNRPGNTSPSPAQALLWGHDDASTAAESLRQPGSTHEACPDSVDADALKRCHRF